MNLSDYIAEIGEKEFARRFDVTERAAASYRYGARRPRGDLAARIVANSPVTLEGIYGVRESRQSAA